MLRALVLVLLLANAAWWAWSQGWLPPSALPFPTEAGQREPQRVAAQQRPELGESTNRSVSANRPTRTGG